METTIVGLLGKCSLHPVLPTIQPSLHEGWRHPQVVTIQLEYSGVQRVHNHVTCAVVLVKDLLSDLLVETSAMQRWG